MLEFRNFSGFKAAILCLFIDEINNLVNIEMCYHYEQISIKNLLQLEIFFLMNNLSNWNYLTSKMSISKQFYFLFWTEIKVALNWMITHQPNYFNNIERRDTLRVVTFHDNCNSNLVQNVIMVNNHDITWRALCTFIFSIAITWEDP